MFRFEFVIILFLELNSAFALTVGDVPLNWTTAFENTTAMYGPMRRFATTSQWDSLSKSKRVLSIPAMINYGGVAFPIGNLCSKAIEIALDRLQSSPNWQPDFELVIEQFDDECADGVAVPTYVRQMRMNSELDHRLPMIVDGSCLTDEQRIVGYMSKLTNFRAVLAHENYAEISLNRQRFSATYSLIGVPGRMFEILLDFIHKQGWRKIGILSLINVYFNKIDSYFISMGDKRNITTLWIGKIPDVQLDPIFGPTQMETVFDEMKKYDPRIIVSLGYQPIYDACWLYRSGLYGPKYVFFFMDFLFQQFQPWIIKFGPGLEWCTIAMTNKILESSVFFGEASMEQAKGPNVKDSLGQTFEDYFTRLDRQVPGASYFRSLSWSKMCYEPVLYSGMLINQTEHQLRKKNDSLLNWTTGSPNYAEKGQELAKLFDEAAYSGLKVDGFIGSYQFENWSLANSKGHYFTQIRQARKTPYGIYESQLVSLYKMSWFYPPELDYQSEMIWNTRDGKAPPDGVTVIRVRQPLIEEFDYAPVAILPLLALVGSAFMLVFAKAKKFHITVDDLTLVLGNSCFLAFSIALPLGHVEISSLIANIQILALLSTVGFALAIMGQIFKIVNGRRQLLRNLAHQAKLKKPAKANQIVVPDLFTPKTLLIIAGSIGTLVGASTAIAVLFFEFFSSSSLDLGAPQDSLSNAGLAFQYYRYEAKINLVINNDKSVTFLLASIALVGAIEVSLLVFGAASAFQAISLRKRYNTKMNSSGTAKTPANTPAKPSAVTKSGPAGSASSQPPVPAQGPLARNPSLASTGKSMSAVKSNVLTLAPVPMEFTMACLGFYCQVLVLLGGIFLFVLLGRDQRYFLLTVASTEQVFAILGLVTLAVGKFKDGKKRTTVRFTTAGQVAAGGAASGGTAKTRQQSGGSNHA